MVSLCLMTELYIKVCTKWCIIFFYLVYSNKAETDIKKTQSKGIPQRRGIKCWSKTFINSMFVVCPWEMWQEFPECIGSKNCSITAVRMAHKYGCNAVMTTLCMPSATYNVNWMFYHYNSFLPRRISLYMFLIMCFKNSVL